ncbi:MAG: hypothetical protein ACE5IK_14540 [Acidobacteriota bacterium]
MMASTKVKNGETRNFMARLPFSDLGEPGTYLSEWSGHLVRIPDDGVKAGRSPVIEIVGKEPMYVIKLSDNPYITLTKARMVAADLDLDVNF